MADWAKQSLKPGQTFRKADALRWFAQHYPKIKPATVKIHIDVMSVNNGAIRQNHPSTYPGSGHDLFWKIASDQYRLWDPDKDPQPLYQNEIKQETLGDSEHALEDETEDAASVDAGGGEFAYEQDLRNYLVKNLNRIEPGLQLYDEEGITGVEFPVGGRFIDILAKDKDGRFVVIELKVSRGYDRVVGQLLRYMGWVEKNMGTSQAARGIIVAKEITPDLKLACSRIPDVELREYEITFKLNQV
jgi:RecB family endonuclease NucS